ncbi:hypothetical protein SUGI_1139000 [Cryptomeria japonica]|nr:hypothetical protein SUGI_1139000 [Cryptomeria japonica]
MNLLLWIEVGIDILVQQLSCRETDVQRAAVEEIRLLGKRNSNNRILIAEAGAIPHLVKLLSSTDAKFQGHAVTALLNLSIHISNKGLDWSVRNQYFLQLV